jgi:hypothetical protein
MSSVFDVTAVGIRSFSGRLRIKRHNVPYKSTKTDIEDKKEEKIIRKKKE